MNFGACVFSSALLANMSLPESELRTATTTYSYDSKSRRIWFAWIVNLKSNL
jgi:hypothetical protein